MHALQIYENTIRALLPYVKEQRRLIATYGGEDVQTIAELDYLINTAEGLL